jgi:Ca2+-binding EF-hand superfamily protein
LDLAFEYLDSDHSGKISASELKQKLGANIPEETYQQLMVSFDKNSDG